MTKVFDGKPVVNNVSLNIYKGQVFILLGHNGAGKTTALSMITGLLKPNSGKCQLHGINVFKENAKLRKILGVCPQETIYYEQFTVEAHLKLFAAFKQLNYEEIKESLYTLMKELDFFDSLNTKGKELSGGQKRKLSVVLALLGKPEVLMLDEPTSGLDVDVRTKIWNVIRNIKNNMIVLMTTHYIRQQGSKHFPFKKYRNKDSKR